MIIVRYKGGLGNQMFQYAMQMALEKRYGKRQVLADVSHYLLQNEHNGYELEQVWGIRLSVAPQKMLKRLSPYYRPGKLFYCLPGRLQDIVRNNLQHRYKERKAARDPYIREHYYRQQDHSSYEPGVWMLEAEKDWYLDGLWQNISYWEDIDDEIREAFIFHNESRYTAQDHIWMKQIRESCSVSVHVRRGDFTGSKFDVCGPEYYGKAMRRLRRELEKRGLNADEVRYFFFTDDPEYVEETFHSTGNKEIIRHTAREAAIDMELMSMCAHHIISNSTFSWWAAWLDGKKNAVVVGPSCSVRKPDRDYPLSAPEAWELLEV